MTTIFTFNKWYCLNFRLNKMCIPLMQNIFLTVKPNDSANGNVIQMVYDFKSYHTKM